jgi:small GTP-binding protein
MLKYKVILAGAKNVGKSSLIARFCDNVFDENMMETIGVAFKRKKVNLKGDHKEISLDLNIWDFGGEEKYRTLFPSYANGASAALILYDTTNRETIEDIANWVKIVDENAYEDVIKILIGTKIDLTEKREITKEAATKACEDYHWCAEAIETSAKTGENVEEAFLNVTREIVKRKLQTCKNCGEVFDKKLKFCQYCGDKVEIEIKQS